MSRMYTLTILLNNGASEYGNGDVGLFSALPANISALCVTSCIESDKTIVSYC
jgi:hypothetical protein